MDKLLTHYDTLNVARHASSQVIEAAYRALTQSNELRPSDSEARRDNATIGTAYAVLTDPLLRLQHDDWIDATESDRRDLSRSPAPANDGVSLLGSDRRAGASSDQGDGWQAAIRRQMKDVRWLLKLRWVGGFLLTWLAFAAGKSLLQVPLQPSRPASLAHTSVTQANPVAVGDLPAAIPVRDVTQKTAASETPPGSGARQPVESSVSWSRDSALCSGPDLEVQILVSSVGGQEYQNYLKEEQRRDLDAARAGCWRTVSPLGKPWPLKTGYVDGYGIRSREGLSEMTLDNRANANPVFLNLYDLEYPEVPVRRMFIRPRERFTARNIDPGRYEVRYRNLFSGELMASDEVELRETPTALGVNASRASVRLEATPGGGARSVAEERF